MFSNFKSKRLKQSVPVIHSRQKRKVGKGGHQKLVLLVVKVLMYFFYRLSLRLGNSTCYRKVSFVGPLLKECWNHKPVRDSILFLSCFLFPLTSPEHKCWSEGRARHFHLLRVIFFCSLQSIAITNLQLVAGMPWLLQTIPPAQVRMRKIHKVRTCKVQTFGYRAGRGINGLQVWCCHYTCAPLRSMGLSATVADGAFSNFIHGSFKLMIWLWVPNSKIPKALQREETQIL